MVCIYCGSDTEIYNSRKKARQPLVWRRRRCEHCNAQFTTHEAPEYTTAIVIKDGDVLTPFERDKLYLSIHFACSHRQDSQTAATSLTETVLGMISRKKLAASGELAINRLTRQIYEVLKRFDVNAAATYKAHHLPSFGR